MKFLNDRINIKVLLIAFGIGMLYCYLVVPTPRIVFSHPTPDNVEKNVYFNQEDKTCYKYNAINVKCDKKNVDI